jgi:hypothetical protein
VLDVTKARQDLTVAALKMRSNAQCFLQAARAKGDRKEAQSWEAELRKINKMITKYGLDRNAREA